MATKWLHPSTWINVQCFGNSASIKANLDFVDIYKSNQCFDSVAEKNNIFIENKIKIIAETELD